MTDIATGMFALAGVALSGVITIVIQWTSRRNVIADRWLQERRQAHTQFLTAANSQAEGLNDCKWHFIGQIELTHNLQQEQALQDRHATVIDALTAVELIADQESSSLAQEWTCALARVLSVMTLLPHEYTGGYGGFMEQLSAVNQKEEEAKKAYLGAVRHELGVNFRSPRRRLA